MLKPRRRVVLTELNLPDKGGELLIKDLRAAGFAGYVAVLTAESDPSGSRPRHDAGANETLQKPCENETIYSCLSMAMGPLVEPAADPQHVDRSARCRGVDRAVRRARAKGRQLPARRSRRTVTRNRVPSA